MLDKHYLTPLFAPSSVVVLAGRADAPETLTPQAAALHAALRAQRYSGTLAFLDLQNTSGTLQDLKQTRADLAVIALPPAEQAAALEVAGHLHCRAALIVSSGIEAQQAQADLAYDIQANIEKQKVVAEEVKVEQVRKEGEIAVQEAEITRREKELTATVLKAAEVERKRIEALAEADRNKQVSIATGRSEAIKLEGLAEAQAILAKGNAEAEAMQPPAAANQEYNQAAVLDRLLAMMPELARALAEPLGRVDKITVVSTGDGGNGGGTGVNRVTADVATMVAQAPAMLEALTGITIGDLLKQVPGMNGKASPNGSGQKSAPSTPQGSASTTVVDVPPTPKSDGGEVKPADS